MKRLVLLLVFAVLSCSLIMDQDADPVDIPGTGEVEILPDATSPTLPPLPADINMDVLLEAGAEFDFSTLRSLPFDITLLDVYQQPVTLAMVTVSDDDGLELTRSVTDDQGRALFTALPEAVSETLTLLLEHPDYAEKTMTVTGVDEIAAVNRQLYTTSRGIEVPDGPTPPPLDSDGDGIPDYMDLFPYDADVVSYSSRDITLAFEDTYPEKGDADFNDVVVALGFMELYNSSNEVVRIILNTTILAAGAGGNPLNKLLINILGTEYTIIDNTKNEIDGNMNCLPGEVFTEAETHELVIEFDPPVARADLAVFPYDPFVRVNDEAGREVHLPFVETAFTGSILDEDGFPWAIVIPRDWAWPFECQDIHLAYPRFDDWYTSGGEQEQDWYSYPELDLVYLRP